MHWALNWFDEWCCWNWKLHSLATTCKVTQTIGQQLERHLFQITCAQKSLAIVLYQESGCKDAFKKHGVSIWKNYRWKECTLKFVFETLIPTMMARIERGIEDIDIAARRRWAITPLLSCLKKRTTAFKVTVYLRSPLPQRCNGCIHQPVSDTRTGASITLLVDGHKKPETLAHWPVFTKQYIAHEVQAHHWVQLSLVASKILEAQRSVAKTVVIVM